MNDVDLLILAVEKEPENTIVAQMLIDELMSAKDMIRSEADRHVRAVQIASINAHEVALVAALMACPGGPRDRLMGLLTAAWPANASPHAQIHCVVGDTPPVKVIGDSTDQPSAMLDVVFVGAKYLLSRVPRPLIVEATQRLANSQATSAKKKKK